MGKPIAAARITQDQDTRLKLIAEGSGSSRSDLVRRALKEFIKNWKGGTIKESLEPQPPKQK